MLKEALPSGGAERQLALVAGNLPRQWECRVWAMAGGPFVEVIRTAGCRVDVAPRAARYDVRPAAHLWRLLVSWRPDVVHSWDWMSTFAAAPLCRVLRIPIVDATIRNGIVRPRGERQRRVGQALSARVVANSRAGLAAWGVGPGKGRVVYNAFDPARLTPGDSIGDAPTAGDPAGDDPAGGPGDGMPAAAAPQGRTAVMSGRMVDHKDFATVIAAARLLDGERPGDWRFLLLGDGPERPRLVAAAGDLEARGVVEFAAPGLEVLPLVRRADAGVLMANEALHREGCSNAIMEYMSAGLPVVCSSGGGNPELVLEGTTGYLVPAGDAPALARALTRLADHPDEARRLGAAGRRRILEEFTIDRLVRETEQIYREAMS